MIHVPAAQPTGGRVPGYKEHRGVGGRGLGERGHGVGEAGAVGGGGDGEFAAEPKVGVGGGDGGLFVANGGVVEALADRGIQEVGVAVAHQSEICGAIGFRRGRLQLRRWTSWTLFTKC